MEFTNVFIQYIILTFDLLNFTIIEYIIRYNRFTVQKISIIAVSIVRVINIILRIPVHIESLSSFEGNSNDNHASCCRASCAYFETMQKLVEKERKQNLSAVYYHSIEN